MKFLRSAFFLVGITAFILHAQAQQFQRCSTDELFEEIKKSDPQQAAQIEKAKNEAHFYSHAAASFKSSRSTIFIPVVVHVMHNNEPVGTGPNISDAQIHSQIYVLNEDYNALNANLANVPAHFTNVIGNPQLQFVLAQIDPEGNPTDGIDRVSMGASGSWSDNRKPGTIWNRDHYLNIWVTEIQGGTLGYAMFPNSSPTSDGVVIDYRYFGRTPHNTVPGKFNLGRTATHEIGHWLGIEHIFAGSCPGTTTNCSSHGDRICDTPPTRNSNFGCNLSTTANTCTESPVDMPDMWMNFMDYTDDACLMMFTEEQVALMHGTLQTSRSEILLSPAIVDQNFFSYSGRVVDSATNEGIANASVFFDGIVSYELKTDSLGNFTTLNFRAGDYDIYAGKWGYNTNHFSSATLIDSFSTPFIIPITKGFYTDDFILNYDWAVSGNAQSGIWERESPVVTNFNGVICNPGNDLSQDIGDKAFVTGNGGGSAGNDDVDDGNTVLKSPLFNIEHYNEPYLSYYRWFCNDGGNGAPDDQLVISIFNGTGTEVLEVTTADSLTGQWVFRNFKLKDFIAPTNTMQLIVETSDLAGSGHLVEAAFDAFSVVDSMPPVSVSEISSSFFSIHPNPANEKVSVKISSTFPPAEIFMMDISGKILDKFLITENTTAINIADFPQGIYLLKFKSGNKIQTQKLSIID